MEAKKWEDTVIHADGCTTNLGIIGAACNCGAERQAEITWDIAFKVGQEAGRKEILNSQIETKEMIDARNPYL